MRVRGVHLFLPLFGLAFGSLTALAGPLAVRPEAVAWLIEADGAIVSAGNEHARLAPASLTKMMTVLIALESAQLTDNVRINKAVEGETGYRIGLKAGEELRIVDLAAAAVIGSANDAARALAEHVGGNEKKFVKLMNDRAKKMGLADTCFTNSSGHDAKGHYSSAFDLAIIANEAMKNPSYAELASMVDLEIRTKAGRAMKFDNKNQLIGRCPGVIGVKSGTTPNAGQSLIALAQRDGRRVLLVLLGAKERWYQSEALFNEVFAWIPTASGKR